MAKKRITNPGSALGEAIGAVIENNLNQIFKKVTEANGYVYISTGPIDPKTGRTKKLILTDESGIEYNIDSVIANEKLQPLILIESKYIRYKKHNRDKGSWVCTAHTSLRKRYSSIRKSITVLAGNWSAPSKVMMESFDITLFEIPFKRICQVLAKFSVDFNWAEKDRATAKKSWKIFQGLSEQDIQKIGIELAQPLQPELETAITETLVNSKPRKIAKLDLLIKTNLGEARNFSFNKIEDGLQFLSTFDEKKLLDTTNSPSLPSIKEAEVAEEDLEAEEE